MLNSNVLALEIIVPINVYQSFSKTISTSLNGSSNIIIDRKDIEKYENTPIHVILDLESGIKSRSIYGFNSSGSKTTLDIRGMGAQAKSNVLILINGQRLNNIDMSEIDFPSIPKESIDRIEVIKGNAATVLYGDGAIGGAINIITNPEISKKPINEVILKTGTFNNQEIIWNTFQKLNKYSLNTYFNHTETDGYRDENEQQQNNITSELRYPGKNGDHFFTINFSEQIMSTPSDRSQDQLFTDRRGSDTPDDYINSLGGSFLYSTEHKISDYLSLILNSSFRFKDSYSDLQSSSFPSYSDTALTNYQFTPRINQLTKKGIKLIKLPINKTNFFDLKLILSKIYSLGCRNLLVEGGKKLTDSFIKNKLFNEFYLYKSANKLGHYGKKNVSSQLHQLSFKYKNKSKINSFTGSDVINIYSK